MIFQTARHDSGHRCVAVANKHFFAPTHELDMGAELRFQIADIHGFHRTIIADLTNLVRFILLSLQGREPAFPRFIMPYDGCKFPNENPSASTPAFTCCISLPIGL